MYGVSTVAATFLGETPRYQKKDAEKLENRHLQNDYDAVCNGAPMKAGDFVSPGHKTNNGMKRLSGSITNRIIALLA